jgi:hypothetical protein
VWVCVRVGMVNRPTRRIPECNEACRHLLRALECLVDGRELALQPLHGRAVCGCCLCVVGGVRGVCVWFGVVGCACSLSV